LKMPDKRPGGGWAPMELIETLTLSFLAWCIAFNNTYCYEV
jgi:hypothetical protein